MNGGTAGAAAAAAAIARAIKASGAIVQVDPEDFQRLLNENEEALVVHAPGWTLSPGHKYLMGYKGLTFYTKAREPIAMHRGCRVIEAKKIWVP